jgi:anaerobic selenocysteine-containing dehydrogenase/histidine ammonia-lyase
MDRGIDIRSSSPAAEARTQSRVGICGVCPAGCAIEAHFEAPSVADDPHDPHPGYPQLTGIKPLAGHPRGIVCPRGARAAEIVASPDRLLTPLRRSTSGDLAPASWDAAYDDIVTRLGAIASEHGPEAVAVYSGRGNFELGLNELFAPAATVESCANAVLFPFGSPNATGVGSFCYAAYGMIATHATFGSAMREMKADLERAELVIVWGANPATDSPPLKLRALQRAHRERGCEVIVIDHRRSETARALDAEWIGVRPGTDGALALALLHVVLAEDRVDHDFVCRWTHGLDELRALVADYPPERAEGICGVPAQTIRQLARRIAATPACAMLMYSGLEYANSGVQTIRAVWCLQALTGHLDVPGGNLFRDPERPRTARHLTAPPPNARRPLGSEEYPCFFETRREAHAALLPQAILEGQPYPVRALIISGSSLITSWPNPALWRRALAQLELLVVIDRFPTADAAYADWLLPATTLFEIESYVADDEGFVMHRPRLLPPRGEARNDALIFAELAARLGYGERWPQSERAMVETALAGTGIDYETLTAHPEGLRLPMPAERFRKWELGALRSDGQPGFETPSGKFELASEWLRGHGYDATPVYREPSEGPLGAAALAEAYPLVLNTGARTQHSFRSQHHNIAGLAKREPAPLCTLHPDDAAARGVVDGQRVTVASPRGEVRFTARVSADIVRGCVEVNMGGGGPLGPAAWREANVNALTDLENRDPISGFPVYKALLCEVRPEAASAGAPVDSGDGLKLGETPLDVATLARAGREGCRELELSEAAWQRIASGRAIVESALARGERVYGVTTGVGSQKEGALPLDAEAQALANRRLLAAHATVLGDARLAPEVVRAALIVQLAGFASGRAGVRPELCEQLLARLRDPALLPLVSAGASVGAADLVPLAQLAYDLCAQGTELAAKEALSLINANAVGLAWAALGIVEARRLLATLDQTLGLSLEGLRGNPAIVDAAVERAHPSSGQQAVAARLRRLLAGSRLWIAGEPRFLQDPLSFRCAPQAHGAADRALRWAEDALNEELVGLADNPCVDLEGQRLISHGNMDATLPTLAIDALRQAIAVALELCAQRLHKLHWPTFSGLHAGLADRAGAQGGVQFLNLGHLAEARMQRVRMLAQPVLGSYRAQLADGVEDVGAPLCLATEQLEAQLEAGWEVLTLEACIASWAIECRGVADCDLGAGLRSRYRQLRALLPRGREGEAIFDLRPLVSLVRDATHER